MDAERNTPASVGTTQWTLLKLAPHANQNMLAANPTPPPMASRSLSSGSSAPPARTLLFTPRESQTMRAAPRAGPTMAPSRGSSPTP